MPINDFDLGRALLRDEPLCRPLVDAPNIRLSEALAQGQVHPTENVLIAEMGSTTLVLKTLSMIYYHVAQGRVDGQDWMVSFCIICNAGAVFSPVVDGRVLHFAVYGLYDAMSLLSDVESRSYWNHITGKALGGTLAGKQLHTLGTLRHATAEQANAQHADALFVVEQLDREELQIALEEDEFSRDPSSELPPSIVNTIGKEDTRLPRLEAGLGIWSKKSARFYPVAALHANDNILFDTFDGRRILIYVDPESAHPDAIYTHASKAVWRDNILFLPDTGEMIENGVVYRKGTRYPCERPLQLFQRWYAFALVHPHGDIYR
jgi:hypothetical protein